MKGSMDNFFVTELDYWLGSSTLSNELNKFCCVLFSSSPLCIAKALHPFDLSPRIEGIPA